MQCFKIKNEDIEGRLDCEFYKPEYMALEKKVRPLTASTLKDYVKCIAGGATPSRDEEEKYYTTNPDEGIPFIRVQNLSEEGLNFNNLKFIKPETNENMLKRSQVQEGDLITKITGVGRMAVSSVAPDGFKGNINQHSVVIKTECKEISEYLATYLNLDFVEKLAKRRSTGGTRPALDYTALQTIPIIYKPEIVPLMKDAYVKKQKKEQEAENLLNSIDDFVLEQLGIKLPEFENKMCYKVVSNELKDNRHDAYYYQPKFELVQDILNSLNFDKYKLIDCVDYIKKGVEVGSNEYIEEGISFVRVSDFGDYELNIDSTDKKISRELYLTLKSNYQPNKEELLFSKDGTVGLCCLIEEEKEFIISGGVLRLKTKEHIDKYYLKALLSNKLFKIIYEREITGAIIKHLLVEKFENLLIPMPKKEIREMITNEYKRTIDLSKQLKNQAKKEFEQAKASVERIILGEEKI